MWLFRFAQSFSVYVDMDEFATNCKTSFYDLHQRSQAASLQNKTFNLDIQELQNILSSFGYPNTAQAISAVQSNDHDQLMNVYSDVYAWFRQSKFPPQQYDDFFKAIKLIRNHMNKQYPSEFTAEDAEQSYLQTIQTTQQNMEKIKSVLSEAISRIPTWSTPIVRIVPAVSSDSVLLKDDYTIPADSAQIEFGNNDWSPSFSYFVLDNRIEIDDVLEAGDEEFFPSQNIQMDYFNLIKELRNPGSSQKGQKKVLYTARPVKDRQMYLEGKVPSNIFLTSTLSDAESIMYDLPGADKERDVWRIVIDSKYLVQTLDAPGSKHYQVVGDGFVPVYKIDLISPAQTQE